jgi:hypothetical protein
MTIRHVGQNMLELNMGGNFNLGQIDLAGIFEVSQSEIWYKCNRHVVHIHTRVEHSRSKITKCAN